MADDNDDGALPAYIEEDAAAAKQQRRQQSKKPKEKMPWDCTTPEEIAAWDLRRALSSKLYEYDPKTGLSSFTRAWFYDLTKFDLDEETQYGPMRFTDLVIRNDHILSDSLNILYLKIMSSDVGYPINLYGTVIVRDRLDYKCINIFRRDRFNCQLIQSEKECLILTGPNRGIVFHGDAFVEIDLKIKEDEGCNDRAFTKGLIALHLASFKSKVESETLVSRLSEVELAYAYVKNALEGTIEIKVLAGPEVFHERVTAYTTDVAHNFLLYDSNVKGGAIAVGDDGRIQLLRRVLAVLEDEMLVFNIFAYPDAHSENISCVRIEFTTRIKGSDEEEISCGPIMQVKVVWSTLFAPWHGLGLGHC